MSCKIEDLSLVSINGTNKAYGGVASSFSFTFSGLAAGGMRASVSISGKNLSRPGVGDIMPISVFGGVSFAMQVASYTKTSSKNSSGLTLNLVDMSRVLDNKFIMLDDGSGVTPSGVSVIGTKRTPMFKDMAGSIVHSPYTRFKKSEKLSDPGVSVAFVANDPFGGTTLKAALGSFYSGPTPNIIWKQEGSFREVICKLAHECGAAPYWDVEEGTVQTAGAAGMAGGGTAGLIGSIADRCGEYSISETVDFTASESSIAYGTVLESENNTSNQQSIGGKMTRYYTASLLDPDFHVGKCGVPGSDTKIDFESEDIKRAMAASFDPKVFGLYVLQCVADNAEQVVGGVDAEIEGRGGSATFKGKIEEAFVKDPMEKPSVNGFLSDYYEGGLDTCKPKIHPVYIADNSLAKQVKAELEKQNKKIGSDTLKSVFQKDSGKFKLDEIFLHDSSTFKSIISENGTIDASDDSLRNYLLQISKFKSRFYVIRGQAERAPTYKGFLLTAEAANGAANFNAPEGYIVHSFNPHSSIADCGISQLQELAATIAYMYKGGLGCDIDLKGISVGWFVRCLFRNQLPNIFGGGERADSEKEAEEDLDGGFQMHLIEKPLSASNVPDFNPIFKMCAKGGKISQEYVSGGEARSIAENVIKYTTAKIAIGDEDSAAYKEKKVNLLIMSKEKAEDFIKLPEIVKARRTTKVWYDVSQYPGIVGDGPSNRGYATTAGSVGDAWKSRFSTFSVSASDLHSKDFPEINDFRSTFDTASVMTDEASWQAMIEKLDKIVEANAWEDLVSAVSTTITFTGQYTGGLPPFSSGIESINISSDGRKITVSITAGNARLRESIRILRDAVVKSARTGNYPSFLAPDVLGGAPNPRFTQLYRGN